jgi:hypothetical protein
MSNSKLSPIERINSSPKLDLPSSNTRENSKSPSDYKTESIHNKVQNFESTVPLFDIDYGRMVRKHSFSSNHEKSSSSTSDDALNSAKFRSKSEFTPSFKDHKEGTVIPRRLTLESIRVKSGTAHNNILEGTSTSDSQEKPVISQSSINSHVLPRRFTLESIRGPSPIISQEKPINDNQLIHLIENAVDKKTSDPIVEYNADKSTNVQIESVLPSDDSITDSLIMKNNPSSTANMQSTDENSISILPGRDEEEIVNQSSSMASQERKLTFSEFMSDEDIVTTRKIKFSESVTDVNPTSKTTSDHSTGSFSRSGRKSFSYGRTKTIIQSAASYIIGKFRNEFNNSQSDLMVKADINDTDMEEMNVELEKLENIQNAGIAHIVFETATNLVHSEESPSEFTNVRDSKTHRASDTTSNHHHLEIQSEDIANGIIFSELYRHQLENKKPVVHTEVEKVKNNGPKMQSKLKKQKLATTGTNKTNFLKFGGNYTSGWTLSQSISTFVGSEISISEERGSSKMDLISDGDSPILRKAKVQTASETAKESTHQTKECPSQKENVDESASKSNNGDLLRSNTERLLERNRTLRSRRTSMLLSLQIPEDDEKEFTNSDQNTVDENVESKEQGIDVSNGSISSTVANHHISLLQLIYTINNLSWLLMEWTSRIMAVIVVLLFVMDWSRAVCYGAISNMELLERTCVVIGMGVVLDWLGFLWEERVMNLDFREGIRVFEAIVLGWRTFCMIWMLILSVVAIFITAETIKIAGAAFCFF